MNGTQQQTLITIGATRAPLSCGGTFCSLPPQDSMYVSVEREGGDEPLYLHAVNNGTVYEASGLLNSGDIVILDLIPPRECRQVMCGFTPIRLGVFSLQLFAVTGEDLQFNRPIRTESFLYGSDSDYEVLEEYLQNCRELHPASSRRVHMNCIPGCIHPSGYRFSYN